MASTYDPTVTSDRNEVREMIGDTIETEWLLDDAVIDRALSGRTVLEAAALCARKARAALIRLPDRSINGISVTRSRLEAMDRLIDDLDARSGVGGAYATMTLTDYSASDAAAELADPDRAPSVSWLTERVR